MPDPSFSPLGRSSCIRSSPSQGRLLDPIQVWEKQPEQSVATQATLGHSVSGCRLAVRRSRNHETGGTKAQLSLQRVSNGTDATYQLTFIYREQLPKVATPGQPKSRTEHAQPNAKP